VENITVEPVPYVIRSLQLMQSEPLPDGVRHTVLGSAHLM
jgi:hypothetical protein